MQAAGYDVSSSFQFSAFLNAFLMVLDHSLDQLFESVLGLVTHDCGNGSAGTEEDDRRCAHNPVMNGEMLVLMTR